MGKQYQNILVALAGHDNDPELIGRALSVVSGDGVINLLHVCEQSVSGWAKGAAGGIRSPEMSDREAVFPVIKALAEKFGIDATQIHIESGNAAEHIDEYAARLKSDLIVTGSHARNGWKAHLGSVANAVVNGAPCDVLTVRLMA